MIFRFLLAPLLLLAHELTIAQAAVTSTGPAAAPDKAAAPGTAIASATPGSTNNPATANFRSAIASPAPRRTSADRALQHIPNRIDSLKTEDQVLKFIRSLYQEDHNLSNACYYPRPVDSPAVIAQWKETTNQAERFGMQPFEKIDLDGNGFTDLLFNGYQSGFLVQLNVLVRSFGRDSFEVRELPKEWNRQFFAAKILSIDDKPCIRTLTVFYDDAVKSTVSRGDTLTWLGGDLAENRGVSGHTIHYLKWKYNGTFGAGPVLEMLVRKDSVTLVRKDGVFVAIMDAATAARYHTLLDHLDLETTKDVYKNGNPMTDYYIDEFSLTYDYRKRKSILDEGGMGPYGLRAIQRLLLSLGRTQNWTPHLYTSNNPSGNSTCTSRLR